MTKSLNLKQYNAALGATRLLQHINGRQADSMMEEYNQMVGEDGDETYYERRDALVMQASLTFDDTGPEACVAAATSLLGEVDKSLVWGSGDTHDLTGLLAVAEHNPVMLESDPESFQKFLNERSPELAHISVPSFIDDGTLVTGAYVAWEGASALEVRTLMPPVIVPLVNWTGTKADGEPVEGPAFLGTRCAMSWCGTLVVYSPSKVRIYLR